MIESPNVSLRDRVEALRLPGRVDDPRAGGGRGWLPWVLCLLLAGATTSMALRTPQVPQAVSEGGGAQPAAKAGAQSQPVPAAANPGLPAARGPAAVTPGAVALEAKGYLIPAHQLQVSPIEVSGRILKLNFEEGKHVQQGEILAELDKTSYEADLAEAVAALNGAKERLRELVNGSRPEEIQQSLAELQEASENLKQMKLEYQRNKGLRGSALSAREYEQAEYAYTAQEQRVRKLQMVHELIKIGPRQERIDASKAEVAQAQARHDRAKWRLEQCTLKAPITGTILKKNAELGNLVSPLSFNVSATLCDMADLSDLEVELDVTERDVGKVNKGMPCRIRAEAFPDRVYQGYVDRLMPIANRAKGAVPVRVKVRVPKEEEGVYLKPEMGAVVAFLQPGEKK
jgi:HlyD family secretion protein